MLLLPNGCKCSKLTVTPKTWMDPNADLTAEWSIHYRFYDPSHPQPKQVRIRGMNHIHELSKRQYLAQTLIKLETEKLMSGWNPFTAETPMPTADEDIYPIHSRLGLVDALWKALEYFKGEKGTVQSVKSVVKGFAHGADALNLSRKPVSQVTRRDIKLILEKCSVLSPRWSDNLFNVYRKYLSCLYKILLEFEAVEINPVKDISKKRHTHKTRAILTHAQRKLIDGHIHDKHYRFWLYMHIFFHSGSRSTELFRLKGRDVNLTAGMFKVTIKKGRLIREEWRPIKDVALGYWKEVLTGTGPDEYLFGPDFAPSKKTMHPNRVCRVWKKFVKDAPRSGGLGIDVDFYSLKHLNLDETAEILSIDDAAKQAGHTTPVVTMEHYAYGEASRQAERLKKVNNKFS